MFRTLLMFSLYCYIDMFQYLLCSCWIQQVRKSCLHLSIIASSSFSSVPNFDLGCFISRYLDSRRIFSTLEQFLVAFTMYALSSFVQNLSTLVLTLIKFWFSFLICLLETSNILCSTVSFSEVAKFNQY